MFGTLRQQLASRLLPQLFQEVHVFMAHYHSERNHKGLGNALICPEPEYAGHEGDVDQLLKMKPAPESTQ